MTLIETFSILIIHWIGDFILQTDKQANGKSKNWEDLLQHTFNYSLIWLLTGVIVFSCHEYHKVIVFFMVTFLAHTITDYFTSRLNSKLWAAGKVHQFFVSIGFDQILHYVQLFLTYQILK